MVNMNDLRLFHLRKKICIMNFYFSKDIYDICATDIRTIVPFLVNTPLSKRVPRTLSLLFSTYPDLANILTVHAVMNDEKMRKYIIYIKEVIFTIHLYIKEDKDSENQIFYLYCKRKLQYLLEQLTESKRYETPPL